MVHSHLRVCIIDFEGARDMERYHYGMVGTDQYRAPEVSLGEVTIVPLEATHLCVC